jgi:uncharacterized membrane protein YgcG
MRSVLALAAVAAAFGFPAHAATDCGRVKAFKDMNLLEIDGVAYRMRSERIGKKSWRLIGHDMYFVHTPGSDTLIRNGGSSHLTCTSSDAQGPQAANPVPYVANSLPTGPSASDDSDPQKGGTQSSSGSSGKGGNHGGGKGGGGKGGGGKGGGGGGGKGGGGKGK